MSLSAGVLALLALPAQALEFGPLRVVSSLNEPLRANLALTGLPASATGLDVHIASAERFQALGVRRTALVDRLRVVTRSAGPGRISVTLATRTPVAEPFVSFVLEVKTGNATALHEYTALLDPAGERSAAQVTDGEPGAGYRTDTAPDRAPAVSSNASARSVAVRPGDTLWHIAERHTPGGASTAQAAWAIYRANFGAFAGSPDRLLGGHRLQIPEASTIRAVSMDRARRGLETSAAAASTHGKNTAGDTGQAAPSASGRLPPAAETIESRSGTEDDATPAGTSTSPGVVPVDAGRVFGRLVLPDDAAFDHAGATTDTSSADAGTPGVPAASDSAPVSVSSAPPTTGTASPSPSSNAAGATRGASDSGSSLFSTRNLIVLLGLLIAVLLLARRRQQQRAANAAPDTATGRRSPADTGTATGQPVSSRAAPESRPGRGGSRATTGPAATVEPAWLSRTASVAERERERAFEDDRVVEDTNDVPGSGASQPSDEPSIGPVSTPTRESLESDTSSVESGTPPSESARPVETASAESHESSDGLDFRAESFEPAERRHDQGEDDEALRFDLHEASEPDRGRPVTASTAGAENDNAAKSSVAMIDPEAFDLYDSSSPQEDAADDRTQDSLEIRLDLARMYIDMADYKAARELAEDVRARGDGRQQEAAGRLLDELPSS